MSPQSVVSSVDWSLGSVLAAFGGFFMLPFKMRNTNKRLAVVESSVKELDDACHDCKENTLTNLASKGDLQVLQTNIDRSFTEQREWISLVLSSRM